MSTVALGEIRTEVRTLRHAGREALRITMQMPTGQAPLSAHIRALTEALCEYAEQALFPHAREEMENAVGSGHAYTFFSHCFDTIVKAEQRGRVLLVRLTAQYYQRERVLFSRTLPMIWTADGALQRKKRH